MVALNHNSEVDMTGLDGNEFREGRLGYTHATRYAYPGSY